MVRFFFPFHLPRFRSPYAPLCCVFLLCVGVTLGQQSTTGRDADASPGVQSGGDAETHDYDVIVIGSEPEGVTAAVAAAQEGARTLLVSEDARVGGLFVLGQMNSLDLRTQPTLYQQGLFLDWWERVGRGASFDVNEAEQAFVEMLSEAGVALRLGEKAEPVLGGTALGATGGISEERTSLQDETSETVPLEGVRVGNDTLRASQIVDATAEADFAAHAGAPYSLGFSSLGLDERMADTLVFRIDGVDWAALSWGVRSRGKAYAAVDDNVAWGHFGGYPAAYEPQGEGLRLRGLNLGKQADGSVLVNALLIYGVDPFNPESVADGYERARLEAPRVIDYLKELPGFADASFGGVAETLYIRETRHIEARCTLSVDDVLGNVVTDEDVVAGGYPLDVQTLTPYDSGYVYGTPEVYGAQLCVAVPRGVENLWVVGKAAGYDPLAASSARVVPFGMALGEAVGVAAAWASRRDISPATFAEDKGAVQALRERLEARGAYLAEVKARAPSGPTSHEFFDAYRFLRGRGLALGGYENEPNLSAEMSARGYLYLLSNVGQRFLGDSELGQTLIATFGDASGALTPELALEITARAACEVGLCAEPSWSRYGLSAERFAAEDALTRGEAYALAAWVAQARTGDAPNSELSSAEEDE